MDEPATVLHAWRVRKPAVVLAATLLAAALTVLGAGPAFAAKPAPTSGSTGADVGWPQCGTNLPTGQLFGIVNANGGTAGNFSPCLPAQYAWATSTSGTTPQGKAALYVNTANPAGQGSWWPTSDTDRPAVGPQPYPTGALPAGPVTYPNGGTVGCSPALGYGSTCAYVYGYVRAEQAVEWAKEQLGAGFDPKAVRWWLDVETANTWQADTAANAASLAGAATYLARTGLGVGVYSTTAQYRTIVGATGTAVVGLPDGERSPLIGLPEWGAGATSLKGAQSNCGVTPFTGGSITLTQIVTSGSDRDVSCRGY
ncbi:MAG: hypothetical protein QOE37_267 [Microbacteriaceae bacterium]|nr:hypothetical protein [Microbacteriaceae bacterium]